MCTVLFQVRECGFQVGMEVYLCVCVNMRAILFQVIEATFTLAAKSSLNQICATFTI